MKDHRSPAPLSDTPIRPASASLLQGHKTHAVPSIVHDVLRSPGLPLDAATLQRMNGRLARDFSDVRIHTDHDAAQSAHALDAAAYTIGKDIVFGAGKYDPGSTAGDQRLTHELVHTMQQEGASSTTDRLTVSHPFDASEREADSVSAAARTGMLAEVHPVGARSIQREPEEGGMSPTPGSDSSHANASPFLASALGSANLYGFETGHAELKQRHRKQLEKTAHAIVVLLRKYGRSTVEVVGFADTVGEEARNLALGMARAGAVKHALIDLGVPEAIITTQSRGEGQPQAIQTKDDVSNPSNRRVEVRFSARDSAVDNLTPRLGTPGNQAPTAGTAQTLPRLDLNYKPKLEVPDPKKPNLPDWFWKPTPPPIRPARKSPLDVVCEKLVDPVVDAVTKGVGLPKSLRDKVKEAARDGVKSGVTKGVKAVAEAAGVKDAEALEAIEKAVEAAIQEKGQSQP